MTKKKAEPAQKAVYTARVKRVENDGKKYYPGDQTTLEGMSPETIGFLLARFYYTPDSWDNVPKAVKDAYDANV